MSTPRLPDVFEPQGRAPQPEYVNRVHRIGHPCTLYGWFCRTHWQMKRPPGNVLLRIFQEGHRWHRRIAEAFAAKGIEYIRQEEPMFWEDLQLSGHMDGLVMPCAAVPALKDGETAVVDVKGMSDFAYASINNVQDLVDSPHWYHKSYVVQPSLYAVHPQVNADWSCLYCVKRSTAETKQLWWRPEDVVELIVKARKSCQAINDAIARDERMPDGSLLVPTNLASPGNWCDDCDYAAVCPEHTLQSMGVVIAPRHITEAVQLRQSLVPAKKQFDDASKLLKAHWKSVGPGEYICGDFAVKVTEVEEKEMPAKPAHIRPGYVTSRITPLSGQQGGK